MNNPDTLGVGTAYEIAILFFLFQLLSQLYCVIQRQCFVSQVKIKGEEVSQQAVRADMLEKRLENARRDGDGKLDAMKQELADAKKTIADKDRQVSIST